jgi:hypothetical protein
MPSVCTKPPEKIREPAIRSLGAAGGGPRRNPASSSAGTDRAWAEGELQTPMALFQGLLGVEAPPACPLGGAGRRRPQERLPRSGYGTGGLAPARYSSSARWRQRWRLWPVTGESVGRSSPWGANGGRGRRTHPR